jgi:hypothetical protein
MRIHSTLSVHFGGALSRLSVESWASPSIQAQLVVVLCACILLVGWLDGTTSEEVYLAIDSCAALSAETVEWEQHSHKTIKKVAGDLSLLQRVVVRVDKLAPHGGPDDCALRRYP